MTLTSIFVLGLLAAPDNPIVVTPPPPVAGLVVDQDGRPVADAEVFQGGNTSREGRTPNGWQGRTDAHGRFLEDRALGFDQRPFQTGITAYHPGYTPSVVDVDPRDEPTVDEPARLVLHPAVGVRLRVVGPDGRPAAGAVIRVLAITGVGPMLLPASLAERLAATTGPDGRAHLAAFSPGDLRLCRVDAPGFGSQPFAMDTRGTGEQTLSLHPVGRLSGRLVSDDPEQARGFALRGLTTAGPRRGESHSVGEFDVTSGPDGRFVVPALAAGWLRIYHSTQTSGLSFHSDAEPAIVAGEELTIEVRLEKAIPVRGVARERGTGRPVTGAWLRVESTPAGDYAWVRTDDAGRFETALLPGRVGVRHYYASPYALPADNQTGQATLAPGAASLELPTLELVRGVDVRGVVLDGSGAAAAGALVEAVRPDGGSVFGPSAIHPRVKADGHGGFVFRDVPPGMPLELTARLGEAASGRPEAVVSGGPAPAALVVSPANTTGLEGRVVDEAGRPVAGAHVSVYTRRKTSAGVAVIRFHHEILEGREWDLITDADGRIKTPRQIPKSGEFRAEAKATDKFTAQTDWLPATTTAFEIVLKRR